MRAVILAAGKGERLLPLTRDTPKCLLNLGDGLTLLGSQLVALSSCDAIQGVVLVLGHLAEQVEDYLARHPSDEPPVQVAFNPFYGVSNNLASLWLALHHVGPDEEIIVINGDNIFDAKIVQGLTRQDPDRALVMVVDEKPFYDEDDMKLRLDGAVVRQVGKEIPLTEANGESIGMILFRRPAVERLRAELGRLMRMPEGMNAFWLRAVQSMIDGGVTCHSHACRPEQWAEIDFHPDRSFVQQNLRQFGDVAARWAALGRRDEVE